jgi:hypothetical protein
MMTTTTTTNSAPGVAGFVLDEKVRDARLRWTMRQMVDVDDRGECAAPIELDVGFWRETASIGVESGRVTLLLRDDDGNAVRVRMPWTSAKALGAALLATGAAIEALP